MKSGTQLSLVVYTDGGSRGNPGPAATGVVIESQEAGLRLIGRRYLGEATNNEAEYQAVLDALSLIDTEIMPSHQQIKATAFFLDSNLVVNQLEGTFRIKQAHLSQLAAKIHETIKRLGLGSVSFQHIPREKNHEADKLVNQALDNVDQSVVVKRVSQPELW